MRYGNTEISTTLKTEDVEVPTKKIIPHFLKSKFVEKIRFIKQ